MGGDRQDATKTGGPLPLLENAGREKCGFARSAERQDHGSNRFQNGNANPVLT